MRRKICLAGLFAVASFSTAACGFEASHSVLAPTGGPSAAPAPIPSGGPGLLTGTWTSAAPLEFPASWSCGDFQWNISSQTENSIAGEFYAVCSGVVTVSATGSGQLNREQVALELNGTAVLENVIPCPFAFTGTGYILDQDALRIVYAGTTCLGPLEGEETLRRPSPSAPEPPPPPPPPSGNPNRVPPGPLTFERAEQVVYATGREFPHLTGPPSTGGEAIRSAEELLLRIIWHLKLAGYDAARQRNPSGAISNDKLNIFIEGAWHAYDVFYDYGVANQELRLIFLSISGENPIPYLSMPD